MRLVRAVAFALSAFATSAAAHDFWLQPDAWRIDTGQRVDISMLVGHGADRQRSRMPADRIVRFDVVAPGGVRQSARLDRHPGTARGDAHARFDAPGTYIIVLESDDRALSLLPAARFNAYLQEEGLTAAIAHRERSQSTAAEGSERYSRHAKAIIDVGTGDPNAQSHVTRAVGLELELVPLRNPTTLGPGETLAVKVLDHGAPLAGALVKLNELASDAQPVDQQRSDADGIARFIVPRAGAWQLNVIWTHPLPATELQAFDTMFSSLAFDVSPTIER